MDCRSDRDSESEHLVQAGVGARAKEAGEAATASDRGQGRSQAVDLSELFGSGPCTSMGFFLSKFTTHTYPHHTHRLHNRGWCLTWRCWALQC